MGDREYKKSRSLEYRAEFAKEKNADMFISLHNNSADKKINGIEVHYYDKTKSNTISLSEKILDANTVFTSNRGKKENNLKVLRTWAKDNSKPGCLVELGFITNEEDLKLLKEKQKDIANDLYEGIKKYYGKKKVFILFIMINTFKVFASSPIYVNYKTNIIIHIL